MKPTIKQIAAAIGLILAVLSIWVPVPILVAVICIGVAVILD